MAGFRPTEVTLREILLEELRNRGVRLAQELSVWAPPGRRGPDAVLLDGGEYVLETKLGDTKYYDDVLKLADWIKWRHIPLRGAFAVLIPGKLRKIPWDPDTIRRLAKSPQLKYNVTALFRDDRTGDSREGSLEEIAGWISDHVLAPSPRIEPDISFVIRVLSGAVDRLDHSLRHLGESDLDDIFGGKTVFDNILQYEEGQYPLNELRKAASYLLINQLIFYGVLSRINPDSYPPLDPDSLRKPLDLTAYFQRVLEVDYAPTFGFDIASRLPTLALEVIKGVVSVIRGLGLERLRHDILGKVFHNLIPLGVRKPVAAFYTNDRAGELLARLAVRSAHDKVMDLAVGSGTLLVAAYRAKQELLEAEKGSFDVGDHSRFLAEDLTGIDIMPFAAHLAVVHLSLQAPEYTTDRVRVAVWDSTELAPDRPPIPPITHELKRAFQRPTLDMFEGGTHPKEKAEYITKGAVTAEGMGGMAIDLDHVDVVIMNPPFTSCDRMLPEYKEALKSRFSAPKSHAKVLRGKLSLQAYFILLADRFLKQGGRVACVLPLSTFAAVAFEGLRKLLTGNYTIDYIITGLGRSAFSEDTSLTEVLLVATKGTPSKDQTFTLVATKKSPVEWSQKDAKEMARQLSGLKARVVPLDTASIIARTFPQRRLIEPGQGLTSLVAQLDPLVSDAREFLTSLYEGSQIVSTLGDLEREMGFDLFAWELRIRGGGYYGFSALSIIGDEERALKRTDRLVLREVTPEAVIAIDRVDRRTYTFPRKHLQKCIRRLSYLSCIDASDVQDMVVSSPFDGLKEVLSGVYGETKAARLRPRISSDWADKVDHGSSRLCLARRIDLAAPGTKFLSTFTKDPAFIAANAWGVRGTNAKVEKFLVMWFNSTLFLFEFVLGRTPTRGTWGQLDRGAFIHFPCPDPRRFDNEMWKMIETCFENVAAVEFPPLLDQLEGAAFGARREMDVAFLRILGVPEEEVDAFLPRLYQAIREHLYGLLAAMRGD